MLTRMESQPSVTTSSVSFNTLIPHSGIGRDLGKGTFGKVRVGTHLMTDEKVAVKILEKDKIVDSSDTERVSREIQILKILRHPVVV